jgi:uncharacterized HAD superfamily protein
MAKKVLYLGNGKWCWTENCKNHSQVIASKNKYIEAVKSGNETKISEAAQELLSTSEGASTYNFLKVQDMKKKLGRTPNIGLDLDGTTGDFTQHLRSYMGTTKKVPKEEWNSRFPNPDEYAMWTGKNAWYANKQEFFDSFQTAEKLGLYREVPIYDNAVETLHELKQYGFNIKVITARDATFNPDTQYWAEKHKIPFSAIINPGLAKETVKDIDVYVDDAPHVINTLIKHKKKIVIMNHEYNENTPADAEYSERVDGWGNEVIDSIFNLLDDRNKK